MVARHQDLKHNTHETTIPTICQWLPTIMNNCKICSKSLEKSLSVNHQRLQMIISDTFLVEILSSTILKDFIPDKYQTCLILSATLAERSSVSCQISIGKSFSGLKFNRIDVNAFPPTCTVCTCIPTFVAVGFTVKGISNY